MELSSPESGSVEGSPNIAHTWRSADQSSEISALKAPTAPAFPLSSAQRHLWLTLEFYENCLCLCFLKFDTYSEMRKKGRGKETMQTEVRKSLLCSIVWQVDRASSGSISLSTCTSTVQKSRKRSLTTTVDESGPMVGLSLHICCIILCVCSADPLL